MPAAAASLREQVPHLPSRTLREAVAGGFEVCSRVGLSGTLLRDLGPEGQHWQLVSTLALEELGRRETSVLEELAAHPPAYLVAAIGRPDLWDVGGGRAARGSWVAAAAQVMAYRLQYAISDPTRALGPSPTSPVGVARETDWRMVMGEIRWSAGNLGEHLIDPRVLGVFDATGRVDPPQALRALNDGVVGHARLGEGREQRVRAAPSHALRKRVAEALGLLGQQPADRSAELERWKAARDATAVLYQQELAADQHRRPGPGDAQVSQGPQQWLSRRVEELDSGIAGVRRAQNQRAGWDARYAEKLATGRLAAGELVQREREALLALEVDPPGYLVAELGRPPGDPAGVTAWRQGAGLIERYRTRYEIGDPSRAFGQTREKRQLAHLALVQRQLDLVRDGMRRTGPDPPALPAPPHGLIPGQ